MVKLRCARRAQDEARSAGIRMSGDDERDRKTLDKLLSTEINAAVDAFGMKVAKRKHGEHVYYGLGAHMPSSCARA